MNIEKTKQFLTKNNINFKEVGDSLWVESDFITSMSRRDSAQARKTARLFAKKYKLVETLSNEEWKYNDKVGNYTFKGQKVDLVEIHFENNKLDCMEITFQYKFIEDLGYSANSHWATKSEREEALWGMNATTLIVRFEDKKQVEKK